MSFDFDSRASDSSFVEAIWRTHSIGGGTFTSSADGHWEMVITKQKDQTSFTVRGPETKASPAPIPEDAEFFGIIFKLGTFMPHIPAKKLVDQQINLPLANDKAFWFNGSSWQFPDYENVDTFLQRMEHNEMLIHDPIVNAVLQDHPLDLSLRSVQRRFLKATGLTPISIRQIQRAQQAMTLLQQGVSVLDTVFETGYYDQAHLTNALRQYMGQTPAEVLRLNQSE